MKLFKWYLIDDIDKMCFENGEIRELRRKLKIAEQTMWEQHLRIENLKELVEYYKSHPKIEIVNLESKGE